MEREWNSGQVEHFVSRNNHCAKRVLPLSIIALRFGKSLVEKKTGCCANYTALRKRLYFSALLVEAELEIAFGRKYYLSIFSAFPLPLFQ